MQTIDLCKGSCCRPQVRGGRKREEVECSIGGSVVSGETIAGDEGLTAAVNVSDKNSFSSF